MNKDRISGLVFMVFCAGYAFSATLIPSLPGEDLEYLTPRTFPYALAVFGIIFSLLLILKSKVDPVSEVDTLEIADGNINKGYDWKLTISLLLLMVAYGILLPLLGFLVATILFLISGYYLMGERSPKTLLLASIPLVVIFWLLLSKVLGVYLEMGSLWDFLS